MIPLAIGTPLVVGAMGACGMGEVYRARDSRLNRDVAIKILPPAFADDRGRMARFEREAQMLAALNHPNIAMIFGGALVMELVEGATLAERIAKGPLSGVAATAAEQSVDLGQKDDGLFGSEQPSIPVHLGYFQI